MSPFSSNPIRGLSALVVAAAVLGGGVGAVQAIAHFGWFDATSLLATSYPAEPSDDYWSPAANGRRPRARFSAEEFDFGVMEFAETRRHAFEVRNDGDFPLVLTKLDSSCVCTLASVYEDAIPPGESARVELEWTAKSPVSRPTPFRQWAKLRTNDPDRPNVTLSVVGQVTAPVTAEPPSLVFTRLARSQTATAELLVLAYRTPSRGGPLEIAGTAWADAAAGTCFSIAIAPVDADALADWRGAKAGCRVAVSVKPGLPPGPFRQTIRLRTNVPDAEPLDVTVEGEVGPDVFVAGRDYSDRTGVWSLGKVSRRDGARRTVEIVAFGPQQSHLRPTVTRLSHDFPRVTFGEPTHDQATNSTRVPMTLEVPPGTPALQLVGPTPANLGVLELSTNHSAVPTLKVLLKVVIE